MKSLSYKLLVAATLIMASALDGFSQTRSKEHDFSPFDAVEASSGFKVSIIKNDRYSAKLTVDDALESYVECYVKSGVLHVGLDDKKVPKDLKKQYKGKNSPEPTLVVVVTMPQLKSLSLSDDSEFFGSGDLVSSELSINLTGSSVANNLRVVGKRFDLNVAKSAKFTNAQVSAEEDINVVCDGKGAIAMECKAKNLTLTTSGSSDTIIRGDVEETVKVTTAATAKATLSGKAEDFVADGKGTSAKIDASALEVKTAAISLGGADVQVNSSKTLELDLARGAEVTFSGNPEINIIKIQNATVLRK